MRYESQSGFVVDDPSDAQLDELLGRLDGRNNSFASLTAHEGSYIQVGGGPDEFTVEIREILPNRTYRHLKARNVGRASNNWQLTVGGASVSVREDQLLDLKMVRELFGYFGKKQSPATTVDWEDITKMFHEPNRSNAIGAI